MFDTRRRLWAVILVGGAVMLADRAAAQHKIAVPDGHCHHVSDGHRHRHYHSGWYPYFYTTRYSRCHGYDWHRLPFQRSFSYYTGPYGGSVYYWPSVIYPPIAGDAGTLFGPRAIWNQLGVTRPRMVANALLPLAPQQDMILVRPDGIVAGRPGHDLAAEARMRARAKQLIGVGDTHFRNGNDRSALRKYRDAIAAAPTFAQGWFRRGFAEVSVGRYDKAISAMERGLRLNPNWPREPFHLREIYSDAKAIAANHDALAQAALANPNDGGLLFLLGVHMHFDGQPDRARPIFRKALAVGDHAAAVLAFLPKAGGTELIPPPNEMLPRGREF